MSTQSHTLTALDAEIAAVEERLNALRSARELLADDEQVTEKPVASKSAKSSSSRKGRVVKDDSDDKPAKRSTKSSNGKGGNTKAKITELLKAGKTPRQIADQLDMRPNYVYHVKRELADA